MASTNGRRLNVGVQTLTIGKVAVVILIECSVFYICICVYADLYKLLFFINIIVKNMILAMIAALIVGN